MPAPAGANEAPWCSTWVNSWPITPGSKPLALEKKSCARAGRYVVVAYALRQGVELFWCGI